MGKKYVDLSDFKEVEGFPNYGVSCTGEVINFKRGKVLSPYKEVTGYCQVSLSKGDGLFKKLRVHRLVAKAFIPNPNIFEMVNHKDGNKSNNCVNNLEWCTALDNVRHAIDSGLASTRGENNGNSRLTIEQVNEVRSLRGTGTHQQISDLTGIGRTTVTRVLNGSRWGGVFE